MLRIVDSVSNNVNPWSKFQWLGTLKFHLWSASIYVPSALSSLRTIGRHCQSWQHPLNWHKTKKNVFPRCINSNIWSYQCRKKHNPLKRKCIICTYASTYLAFQYDTSFSSLIIWLQPDWKVASCNKSVWRSQPGTKDKSF